MTWSYGLSPLMVPMLYVFHFFFLRCFDTAQPSHLYFEMNYFTQYQSSWLGTNMQFFHFIQIPVYLVGIFQNFQYEVIFIPWFQYI